MVIKTGFGLALLILVGLGVRSYQNTRTLIGNTSEMDHAFRVNVALDELVIHVVASENTLRAALLANDESLLAAYHKNADLSGRSMEDLERALRRRGRAAAPRGRTPGPGRRDPRLSGRADQGLAKPGTRGRAADVRFAQ